MRTSHGALPLLAALVLACGQEASIDLSPGVSWSLAEHRAETISDLRYHLTFDIPEARNEPVRGHEIVSFTLAEAGDPVVLDFVDPASNVIAVWVDGAEVSYEATNEHVIISAGTLEAGPNAVEIEFVAGDASLNRREAFLYTLFVPTAPASRFQSSTSPTSRRVFR